MDNIDATYNHKNFLVRYFFNRKTNLAIKLANLKKNDIILDFGCGSGQLKTKLKNYNIICYDITPEHSDIEDYRSIKPTKIFALDVFEHIKKSEIEEIILNFTRMNSTFTLITIIPTENIVSRKLRQLIGKPERAEGHITHLKEILGVLNKYLIQKERINFYTISVIAKFTTFDHKV